MKMAFIEIRDWDFFLKKSFRLSRRNFFREASVLMDRPTQKFVAPKPRPKPKPKPTSGRVGIGRRSDRLRKKEILLKCRNFNEFEKLW